ncbi:uncharacterized protein [Triticum aestivum]|uniref:uncharacterized protein n=1 Tax=Triticum aestivum TaxID=4565 RepID=UPI001D003525|nr:uncharacterized protein LOC123041241 [Triticum aestivum]
MLSPPSSKITRLTTSPVPSQHQSHLCYYFIAVTSVEEANGGYSEAQDPRRGGSRRHHGRHGLRSRWTSSRTGLRRIGCCPGCRHGVPDCAHLRLLLLRQCYLQSHCIDPYMVVTHSNGGQRAFGYWVYSMGDGSTRYFQPIWMAFI